MQTRLGLEQDDYLELDSRHTGAPISPLLFGHNLETTRRGVWRGLSAEMVANRKFAAGENGLPKRWTVMGDEGRVVLDDSEGYAGARSVRIEIQGASRSGGIAQEQEALAFQQGALYALRVWLKSDAPRTVRVKLVETATGRVLFEQAWHTGSGDWELLSGAFAAPSTSEMNRLEISSRDTGVFRIGAVSVQSSNAFHGMRRDVIEVWKQLRPGSLRWPGGCYAEFYSWQEGLLPVDQRPPIGPTGLWFLLPDSDDYDTHEIGIDEFIALCRAVGSEPAITVRLSETHPEDAAALVEYCNGGPDTPWGKVRAQRGQPAPYSVKHWFAGNELWSFGRGELNDADMCARQTRLFARAMKHVDPTLRLAGCTHFGGDSTAWNRTLIEEAGNELDLYSVHNYLFDGLGDQQDLGSIARAPTEKLRPLLAGALTSLQHESPAGSQIGLSFDEWNTRWGLEGSVGMGLYVAGVLNLLCREAGPLRIEQAFYFMPVNEGAIRVSPLGVYLDAAGEVFALFRPHQGNRVVRLPERPPDADLDLCASASPDGRQLYVTAVNRNIHDERTIELRLQTFAGSFEAGATLLAPESLEANARGFRRFSPEVRALPGKRILLTLPPGAIAGIQIKEV